jgi:osmoprotectant transport system substrate-binding protein
LRIRRTFASIALLVLAAGLGCGRQEGTTVGGSPSPKNGPKITIGSANFAESQILAEIYAQGLAAKGYKVGKKLNIGAREVYFPALLSGHIDMLPEYTGSTLAYLTKEADASKPDAETNYQNLVAALRNKNITALEMAAAQDQDGIVVNKQTAEKYGLKKVSDLKAHASELVMGGPPECPQRHACLKGLEDVYGIHFKDFKPLDVAGPITVKALKSNEIQVADLFTTQSAIPANGFVLLEQDPPIAGAENVVPIVRDEIVEAYGDDLKNDVNAITAKITTKNLTAMNKRVEIDKDDADQVAADWLESEGLVP